MERKKHTACLALLFLLLITGRPSTASANLDLLTDIIISYNVNALNESLNNDSYRGEEGYLRIKPEHAKALGMKVFVDQSYFEAKALVENAGRALKRAKSAMTSRKKEKIKGEHIRRIAENILAYRTFREEARKTFSLYHSRIDPDADDRLDQEKCRRIVHQLLIEGRKKTHDRLRDTLGYVHNLLTGNRKEPFLTPENVRFVNNVFRRFTNGAGQKAKAGFYLDRVYENPKADPPWEKAVGGPESRFIPMIQAGLTKCKSSLHPVDPLLFISLMKRESAFDPRSISRVGAAGLTQIMPQTARKLGMKNIYMPPYYTEAGSLMARERKLRKEAVSTLFEITGENKNELAQKARTLMQKSLELKRKQKKLFKRYRRELSRKKDDERLKEDKAIEYGLRYFAQLLDEQQGDISLALAAYNAGPHRVRQYQGIPPFGETVRFRNRVLDFYREYHDKMAGK